MVAPPLVDNYAYCETKLRGDDADRWLASLFLPPAVRPHVQALYAFSLEIARARELVSEPMLGEIRLQWWRDVLTGDAPGDSQSNPIAAALIDTVARYRLGQAGLVRLIDARLFDLYDSPMPSLAALETYTRDTSSVLFAHALAIFDLDVKPDRTAADHAGIAYAVTGLLRALPWHAARGQVYLPADLLAKHDLTPDDVTAGRMTPALSAVLAEMRALARRHLAQIPAHALPPLLPVRLCEPYLRQMEKRDYDPFKTAVALPQWRRQWILWRAA